jgi:HK97 family phage prohead protease
MRAIAPSDVFTRTFTTSESRVDVGSGRHITGFPIVFDKQSEDLGGWREVILPEAADRTFREAIDVRGLVDHDTAKILGRLTAGTMLLRKETRGVHVDIDPPKTSYAKDIVESISRRDVTGMSFRFRIVGDDGVFWDFDVDPPIRYVRDMRFEEVSVVTFPAYTDTEVVMRALRQGQTMTPTWKPSLAFRERLLKARR